MNEEDGTYPVEKKECDHKNLEVKQDTIKVYDKDKKKFEEVKLTVIICKDCGASWTV